MKPLPKKVRKAMSADESFERYVHLTLRELENKRQLRQSVRQIEAIRKDGNLEILQILHIYNSPDGLIIKVASPC